MSSEVARVDHEWGLPRTRDRAPGDGIPAAFFRDDDPPPPPPHDPHRREWPSDDGDGAMAPWIVYALPFLLIGVAVFHAALILLVLKLSTPLP